MKLLARLGLTYIATDELTIRALRHGRGFRYVAPDGTPLRGEESQRLAALAVPPAYDYAAVQSAHIPTIGRDAGASLWHISSVEQPKAHFSSWAEHLRPAPALVTHFHLRV
jgi:DNA topoisomerase IB